MRRFCPRSCDQRLVLSIVEHRQSLNCCQILIPIILIDARVLLKLLFSVWLVFSFVSLVPACSPFSHIHFGPRACSSAYRWARPTIHQQKKDHISAVVRALMPTFAVLPSHVSSPRDWAISPAHAATCRLDCDKFSSDMVDLGACCNA